MNRPNMYLSTLLTIALVGCSTRSEPGGGPEKTTKFTMSGPASTTSIKQGETQTVALKLERGKDFRDNVKLKVEAPTGVDAVLADTSIKSSEKGEVSLKIGVDDKATVGEHKIRVTGTPDTGSATTLDVTIKVLDRAENVKLTLKGPATATSIKQGDTQTVAITLQPSAKRMGSVTLDVTSPKGLTSELTATTVKTSDSGEVGLKITALKTAPLGEHIIRVSGTPDAGTVSSADVKVTVVAP